MQNNLEELKARLSELEQLEANPGVMSMAGMMAVADRKDALKALLLERMPALVEAMRWKDTDAGEFPEEGKEVEFYAEEWLCFGTYSTVKRFEGWWNNVEGEGYGPGSSVRVPVHVRWWRERHLPPLPQPPAQEATP